jgi:hypothetical protein
MPAGRHRKAHAVGSYDTINAGWGHTIHARDAVVVIAAVQDPAVGYPTSEDYFSPDRAWPEYRLGHVSGRPNPAYSLVRKCLADAGLDSVNFGKAAWNPLGAYISPGDRVFLMCNFVEQKIGAISDEMLFAKCTHGSVIRAMIDYVLIALQGKGSIGFGNAPLQSCDWNAVIDQTGALQVQKFFTDIHRKRRREAFRSSAACYPQTLVGGGGGRSS